MKILLWPIKTVGNLLLDCFFGKAEEFEYPHSTTPDPYASN